MSTKTHRGGCVSARTATMIIELNKLKLKIMRLTVRVCTRKIQIQTRPVYIYTISGVSVWGVSQTNYRPLITCVACVYVFVTCAGASARVCALCS